MTRAAIIEELGAPLVVSEIDVLPPAPGEVAVRIAASGICHSDVSVQNGKVATPFPIVPGHEGAGVVTAIGEGVRGIDVGDHVVLSWLPECGSCYWCLRGEGYLCATGLATSNSAIMVDGTHRLFRDGQGLYQMNALGTFSENIVVPASSAIPIHKSVDLRLAALLGCGVLTGVGAAMRTATIRPGDSVAVIGCGGVGLNVIQGARFAEADTIVAVEMNPDKRQLAMELGATHVVDPAVGDPVEQIKDLTDGRGADVVFEVIGAEQTITQSVRASRRGGQTILVGIPGPDVYLKVRALIGVVLQAKDIRGSWYGSCHPREDIPILLELYESGSLKLDKLISTELSLDEVNKGFELLQSGTVARSIIVFD